MDMISATRSPAPAVLLLADPRASDRALTGAKAANLAEAGGAGLPVLPGAVLTTAWAQGDRTAARTVWRHVSADGARPVIVRSSSTGEDGAASSMAGVFDSVLDVRDPQGFDAAVATVLGSATSAARDGLVDAAMAILVQPMLPVTWGGVLFTADPVTGRRDRIVVAASPAGPAAVVSGVVDGWTAVLTRRGRVTEVRSAGPGAPSPALLRQLVDLARQVRRAFDGPQDVEWSLDADGTVRLLQARPITTLPPRSGPVFGAGPIAESFPDALAPLERDLWLDPVRDGLLEALRLTGTVGSARLARSPLVIAVDGLAAVDLDALGADDPAARSVLARFDPRPPARRLRAAWRVGRLRHAVPRLAADLVTRADEQLLAVPAVDGLSNAQLLALLRNGRRTLVSLHGHEALAGLLIPEAAASTVTGASLALAVLAETGAECSTLDELVAQDPVVLALVPPHIGPLPALRSLLPEGGATAAALPADAPDEAAVAREALRLRIRWLQELTGRAAWELGRRLVDVGLIGAREQVRSLTIEELEAAVQLRTVPADLAVRVAPRLRHLPARFRLTDDGQPVAVPVRTRRRGRAGSAGAGVGAGGGRASGPVVVGGAGTEIPAGSVLVVPHLDPRLAAVIPRLAALVAETGSPLSHLAILAREAGVATVVGLAGATTDLRPGQLVEVDGQAGAVSPVGAPDPVIDLTQPAVGSPPEGLLPLGAQP